VLPSISVGLPSDILHHHLFGIRLCRSSSPLYNCRSSDLPWSYHPNDNRRTIQIVQLLLPIALRPFQFGLIFLCSFIMSVIIRPVAVSLLGKNVLNLNDWLTVHHSITLVDLHLDVQNSCLFAYNTFIKIIKILYMFRALPCSSSGGLRPNCIYAASGIVRYQRLHIYTITYTCRGF
jgi:hypothetical protein